MPLILQGATSGQATLQATDAQTVTITMPATSGTLVTTGGAQTIEFADGSASAPSITNSGDTNTGMFFPAADTIAFTEGGTESMRIDSSGNLGVGTTSPGVKLDVMTSGSPSIIRNTTYRGAAGQSAWASQFARGTSSSPTTVLSGDTIGAFEFYPYNGTNFSLQTASISTLVTGTVTSSSIPTAIVFGTDAAGAAYSFERMRIDSIGNVGVGITPSAWSTSNSTRAIQISSRGSVWANVNSTSINNNWYLASGDVNRYINTAAATRYVQDATGIHQWFYAPSGTADATMTLNEAMRIDANGYLLVNRTSSTSAQVQINHNGASAWGILVNNINPGTGQFFVNFQANGTGIGSIAQSGGSNVVYNTSSDYRLKENIAPMTGALATVAALKPVTYKWKIDGTDGQGFIAHELAEVVPDCVTGEKDGMRTEQYEVSPAIPATFDEDGNELTPAVEAVMGEREVPAYQGVDTSFLVATLTAAIQELKATVDAQAARIAALEGAK